jgi:NAD(P)-dependent dehydrogenase (short-subunit alcohol dehydrogenase family)
MTDLSGKVALITGAGSGIGRAAARLFAAAGARVGITDIDKEALAGTAALLPADVTVSVAGDIVDPATMDELTTAAVTRFGRVDVLFNNVGILIMKSLLDTTPADFDRLMHVNCLSYLIAMQRVVPEMLGKGGGPGGTGGGRPPCAEGAGGGSIINVSSVGGLVALPNVSAYCPSKSAVIGLTRAAAAEFAPDVRVNVICPGGVSTPMSAAHLESFADKEAAIKQLTGRQLLKRYALPEEIANVAVFLASDQASFMTGAVVPVEAGHTAW